MSFKDLLKHNIVARKTIGFLRRLECKRLAKKRGSPFDGDRIISSMVEFLLDDCGVKCFVESGTYLGYTSGFIASRQPNLPVVTIESNPDYFVPSQKVLRKYANVRSVLGDSPTVISELSKNGFKGLPLFFLDAHWYSYLPLPEELRNIGEYLHDAIIIIHDFQVPGKDYGFDVYNGKSIGMEMLSANINKNKSYEIYLPCYSSEQAYGVHPKPHKSLRGYAIIFQEAGEAAKSFASSEYAKWCVRGDLK